MADIVNLNRFRKEKERAGKKARAAENRAAHGRSKADKDAEKARRNKDSSALDQHRLDDGDGPGAA